MGKRSRKTKLSTITVRTICRGPGIGGVGCHAKISTDLFERRPLCGFCRRKEGEAKAAIT